MKNKVTKAAFLSWYFSSHSDALDIGYGVISALMSDGEYIVRVRDLFDSCGYIPSHICIDATEEDIEYNPSEVELINSL